MSVAAPLPALSQDPLRAIEEAVPSWPLEGIPDLVGTLARLSALALLRLAAGRQGGQMDELLDVRTAAAMIGVKTGWLYQHHPSLPFTVRHGKLLRFSRTRIESWIKRGGSGGSVDNQRRFRL